MKTTSIALILAAGLALAGCAANYGTQTVNDFNRYMQLQPGQTTSRDIFQSFGQPHQVDTITETGERVWSYHSIRERTNATTYLPFVGLVTGGSDIDATTATFYFDQSDTLLRSEREERSRYKNMWLGMADSMTGSGDVARIEAEMSRLGLPFDESYAARNAFAADTFAD